MISLDLWESLKKEGVDVLLKDGLQKLSPPRDLDVSDPTCCRYVEKTKLTLLETQYFWQECSAYANSGALGNNECEATRRTLRHTTHYIMLRSGVYYREPFTNLAKSGLAGYYFIGIIANLLTLNVISETRRHDVLGSLWDLYNNLIARNYGSVKLSAQEKLDHLDYQELALFRFLEVLGRSFDIHCTRVDKSSMQFILDMLLPLYERIGSQHCDLAETARIYKLAGPAQRGLRGVL